MKNTVCTVILSILSTEDNVFIEKKINALEAQVKLNEIEKSIVKDIKESLLVSEAVSVDFINDKYSFYVDSDDNTIPVTLSKDSIDSAIVDIRIKQARADLAKSLITLGSKIDSLSAADIKDQYNRLYSNVLIEHKHNTPENDLMFATDPYGALAKSKGGLSLLLPEIEAHAGKATKGSVVSILAFTGSFKSTYALNLAYDNALKGHNVLYLSLESTGAEMINRLVLNHIANRAEVKDMLIKAEYVRDQKLRDEQIEYYNKMHNAVVREIGDHFILWDSTKIEFQTLTDMTNILRLADKQFIEKTGKGLDAVFVDQLSLLKYTAGSGRKASYDGAIINDWVSYFREQALNFLDESRQIVSFLVAQTSRDAFAEASKRNKRGQYDASCSSDSHEIERSSSTMITIFKDTETKDTVLINIPKARNGFSPDRPIQLDAYGDYYHMGPLKFSDSMYTEEYFSKEDISEEELDIADLI